MYEIGYKIISIYTVLLITAIAYGEYKGHKFSKGWLTVLLFPIFVQAINVLWRG